MRSLGGRGRKATAGSSTPPSLRSGSVGMTPHLLIIFRLLFRIERVLGVFEELVLELEAFVVGLDGFEGISDLF